jgi:hypothetical protein
VCAGGKWTCCVPLTPRVRRCCDAWQHDEDRDREREREREMEDLYAKYEEERRRRERLERERDEHSHRQHRHHDDEEETDPSAKHLKDDEESSKAAATPSYESPKAAPPAKTEEVKVGHGNPRLTTIQAHVTLPHLTTPHMHT